MLIRSDLIVSKWIQSKRSSYLINHIKDIDYERYDRKLIQRIVSILIRLIVFLFTFLAILFDLFDLSDLYLETFFLRRTYGPNYLFMIVCLISIDISLISITLNDFKPLKKNMFILLPLTLMNWTFFPNKLYTNHYHYQHRYLIEDCSQTVLDRIKLILITAELFCPIFLASLGRSRGGFLIKDWTPTPIDCSLCFWFYFFVFVLIDLFATLYSLYTIGYHLYHHDRIQVIVIDLIMFLIHTINGRLFMDFANNSTVYISTLKTYFSGNYKQINENFRTGIIEFDCRKQSQVIWRYLHQHNNLCKLLKQVNYTWSFGNFFTIIFNLPVNIILVNILLHYELSSLKKILFTIMTISHSLVMLNLLEVLHPIHRNAHGSKREIAIFFAQNLHLKSGPSLRLRIKLINYLERLTSKQKQLGVSIGFSKPINHMRLWNVGITF